MEPCCDMQLHSCFQASVLRCVAKPSKTHDIFVRYLQLGDEVDEEVHLFCVPALRQPPLPWAASWHSRPRIRRVLLGRRMAWARPWIRLPTWRGAGGRGGRLCLETWRG